MWFGLSRPDSFTQRQGSGVIEGLKLSLQIDRWTIGALRTLSDDLDWWVLLVEPCSLYICLLLGICLIGEQLSTEVRYSFDSLIFKCPNMPAWLLIVSLLELLLHLFCAGFSILAKESFVCSWKEGLTMIRAMLVEDWSEPALLCC